MSIEPAPIVVEPSGDFLGNDGPWSAFEIEVGVPPQKLQVIPSTEIAQTLVVAPEGCIKSDNQPSNWNCANARGGIYNGSDSEYWIFKNNFTLSIAPNLGLSKAGNWGAFGYDTLSIQTANGGNVTVDQQLLSGVATPDLFVGSLGLSSRPISFQSKIEGQPDDTRQSLITSLKNKKLIPSLSYGYTAGASYRNRPGSLTLGGYDASRFVPNDLSVRFDSNPAAQLVVALNKITFTDSDSTDKPLLTEGIRTLIDSTVPEIWLPLDACKSFEDAFGISYEPIKNRYFVNSTQHDDLKKQNANITFEIGSSIGSDDSIRIVLPYKSFDLEIGYPLVVNSSRYFPLRRAADDTQFTLGRALLQESFLIVDYGNQNFSISQATTSESPANIVAISASNVTQSNPSSTETPTPNGGPAIVKTGEKSSGLPVGAIAGIVVAIVVIILACGAFFYFKIGKKRKDKRADGPELPADAPYPQNHAEVDGNIPDSYYGKKEAVEASAYSIPTGMESPRMEMGDDRVYFEGSQTITELPTGETIHREPINRSELSSPEPISRQASPTPDHIAEFPSRDPQWYYTEMATPTQSPPASPPPETYSALSSPQFPRPPLGTRRPAPPRLSSTASDESGFMPIQRHDSQRSGFSKDGTPLRPPHGRKDSDDSGFTQDTLLTQRPSQFARKDSTESGVTFDPIPKRKPSFHRMNTNDSDPLMSPKVLPSQPYSSRESATMETRMEEEMDSDTEVHAAELVRRASAQLINQMSPPASPSKKSLPRKEVASPPHSYSHTRQDSGGPPSAFSSPRLESSSFTGRMRSSSRGSKFEERFMDDVPEGNLDSKRS